MIPDEQFWRDGAHTTPVVRYSERRPDRDDPPEAPLNPTVRYSRSRRGWHDKVLLGPVTLGSKRFADTQPEVSSVLSIQTGNATPLPPGSPFIPFVLTMGCDGGKSTRNLFLPPWGIALPVAGGTTTTVDIYPSLVACDATLTLTEGAPIVETVPVSATLSSTFAGLGVFVAVPVDFSRTATIIAYGSGLVAVGVGTSVITLVAGVPITVAANVWTITNEVVGTIVSVDVLWGVQAP